MIVVLAHAICANMSVAATMIAIPANRFIGVPRGPIARVVWRFLPARGIKRRIEERVIERAAAIELQNISSLEVEEVLYRHPQVLEAAVVARPDDKYGETPCAFVTPRPGAETLSAQEIIAWCRDNMAHFKAPRTVVFGPLPKTSTGKIQKFVLRDQAKQLGDSPAR